MMRDRQMEPRSGNGARSAASRSPWAEGGDRCPGADRPTDRRPDARDRRDTDMGPAEGDRPRGPQAERPGDRQTDAPIRACAGAALSTHPAPDTEQQDRLFNMINSTLERVDARAEAIVLLSSGRRASAARSRCATLIARPVLVPSAAPRWPGRRALIRGFVESPGAHRTGALFRWGSVVNRVDAERPCRGHHDRLLGDPVCCRSGNVVEADQHRHPW